MSTFKGVMEGFEDIRVDYFRPAAGLAPPRACFLSHVHSDHLAGLDSKHWKTSFIYCSPATREILLRLERRVDRVGFEMKTLAARKVQYGHLEKLLKPIPLGAPTQIELKPGVTLQVTLFDANHCAGAVMFLFEMDNLAVLYTGDIRSEPWHVSSLARNPLLLEYTSGIKTLDCIYLDTSRTDQSIFPPKAEGLKELLQKVLQYPADTIFHLSAWTYGYEEVWMALSKALKSQIHVNKYTYRIFESLRGVKEDKKRPPTELMIQEGPTFAGYTCGNSFQPGCLTTDPNVRLHSCEKGMKCPMLGSKTVWITPIVRWKDDAAEVPEPEPAVIQSGNDLSGRPQIEFDDNITIDQLMLLFPDADPLIKIEVRRLLVAALESPGRALFLGELGLGDEQEEISLDQLGRAIVRSVTEKQQNASTREDGQDGQSLPRTINFPYSRHSSYPELCELLKVFAPKDVWPCTENPLSWHEDSLSIRGLFGCYCSAQIFRYDAEMKKAVAEAEDRDRYTIQQTQTTESSQRSLDPPGSSSPRRRNSDAEGALHVSPRAAMGKTDRIHPVLASATDSLGSSKKPVEIDESPPIRKNSTLVRLQRNQRGQLRPYDENGNEVQLSWKGILRDGSAGPESLRRKEAPVTLEQNSAKRLRPTAGAPQCSIRDDDQSSDEQLPLIASNDQAEELCRQHGTPAPDLSGNDHANTPGSGTDGDQSDEMEPTTYYDAIDEIFRCISCGHEVWGEEEGYCMGCGTGEDSLPYFEDAQEGPLPQVALDAYTDDLVVEHEDVQAIVGACLDYDSSAYDSQDSGDENFNEDYEENSMIDNAETPEPESEDEQSSSSADVDWEAKFRELQAQHSLLETNLVEVRGELQRVVFGSEEFEDSEVFEDDVDEDGILMVEAAAPEPTVTEIVLSQARGQSQESEISEYRILSRAEAFEAARSGGWHDVSTGLASISGHHQEEEVEL
ncbi:hypothetical protein LZ554_008203 [Drepanopeziza brunnea f. sp. 'monogermtubi']|nr:hypothetical protein LZ554_008203 [Drepanopeziza brunnea f. sp. 'monogermtubi']